MMKSSSFFVCLLLVDVVSAQNPLSHVILGGDGHGKLKPTPLNQAILGADGHGTFNQHTSTSVATDPEVLHPSTSTNIEGTSGNGEIEISGEDENAADVSLLGADGHGIYNPDKANFTSAAPDVSSPSAVTTTFITPKVVQSESSSKKENKIGLTETQLTPDLVTGTQETPDIDANSRINSSGSWGGSSYGSGSGSSQLATTEHDSFWTFTHYSNNSVCWGRFASENNDDYTSFIVGDEKIWCASGRAWHLFTFASHVVFWTIILTMIVMACTIHKRSRQNRELRERVTVMEINGMEYGDFVQATNPNDDRIKLVPPSYQHTGSSQFPEKARLGGGWIASVA